ncbi:MAG: hypothetical protein WDZ41_03835 [Candidatus Babeliales bacterium]
MFVKKKLIPLFLSTFIIFPYNFQFIDAHDPAGLSLVEQEQLQSTTEAPLWADFLDAGVQAFPIARDAAEFCSQDLQYKWYGNESVSPYLETMIRNELKDLEVAEWKTLPIKKKKNANKKIEGFAANFLSRISFQKGHSYDALMIHPTNKCIFVDEEFMHAWSQKLRQECGEQKSEQIQKKFIKSALQHYTNNTYAKIGAVKTACIGIGAYVISKLTPLIAKTAYSLGQSALQNLGMNQENPEITTEPSSATNILKSLGNLIVTTTITSYLYKSLNEKTNNLTDQYVDGIQKEFDAANSELKNGLPYAVGVLKVNGEILSADKITNRIGQKSSEVDAKLNPLKTAWIQKRANLLDAYEKEKDSVQISAISAEITKVKSSLGKLLNSVKSNSPEYKKISNTIDEITAFEAGLLNLMLSLKNLESDANKLKSRCNKFINEAKKLGFTENYSGITTARTCLGKINQQGDSASNSLKIEKPTISSSQGWFSSIAKRFTSAFVG